MTTVITIRHDHANGTTIHGSTKGDGVLDLLQRHGFTWSRTHGIHISGSRDTWSWSQPITAAADTLRDAGYHVTLDISDAWRPARERATDRAERVEARVERLTSRAAAAQTRSDTARANADRIADGIPLGQPILQGHHSQPRAERDAQRIRSGTRKAITEQDYANHLADRADGTAANEAAKHNPRAIMRRIESLEGQVRAAQRYLAAQPYVSRPELKDTARSRRVLQRDRDIEEIAYLSSVLAEHADAGSFIAWSRDNIAVGDRVQVHNVWYPVLRVNTKSVSVGVTGSDGWRDTIKWDKITGRRRGGLQIDTPNGEPWPAVDADKVARWNSTAQSARLAAGHYSEESSRQHRNYQLTLRLAVDLPFTAGDPEVEAHLPAQDDVSAIRAFAILCHDIHRRLRDGDEPRDIAVSTPAFPTRPRWRIPTVGEPVDVRIDQLAPGDLVAGIWDQGYNGRRLLKHLQGPVTAVSPILDRRESGRWVTVTIDGAPHDHKTHIWTSAYRAGTWEEQETTGPTPDIP